MKAAILMFITGLLILTGTAIYTSLPQKTVTVASTKPTKPLEVPLDADTIFNLVNEERIKAGVKPLVRDARLVASAQIKADDMHNNNYFAHINPETGVNGPSLIPSGLCTWRSENISEMLDPIGNNNKDTINGWLNSKPHKIAMLDPQYDISGLAVSGTKVVQHFCNLR